MKLKSVVILLVAVLAGVIFVRNFSGLHFSIADAPAMLATHLSTDLKVKLDTSISVERGVSVASRDPGEYYQLRISRSQRDTLLSQLAASTKDVKSSDPARVWTMGRVPSWWRPNLGADSRQMDIIANDGRTGYILLYSDSSDELFVFWFRA